MGTVATGKLLAAARGLGASKYDTQDKPHLRSVWEWGGGVLLGAGHLKPPGLGLGTDSPCSYGSLDSALGAGGKVSRTQRACPCCFPDPESWRRLAPQRPLLQVALPDSSITPTSQAHTHPQSTVWGLFAVVRAKLSGPLLQRGEGQSPAPSS